MSEDDPARDTPDDDPAPDTPSDEPRADGHDSGPENEEGESMQPPSDGFATESSGLAGRRGHLGLWVTAAVLFLAVVYVAWRYVGTVVVGLFLYYVTRPVFDRIHAQIESRTIAVSVALLTVALPVLGLVAWALSVAARSLTEVLANGLGDQVAAALQPYADLTSFAPGLVEVARAVVEDPMRLADLEVGSVLSQSLAVLGAVVGELFAVGLHTFIVLIIVFYLLRDDYRLAGWARQTFFTPDGIADRYLVAIDRDLQNVFFGNILNALLTGFLAVLTYFLLNAVSPPLVEIPQPALVGLLVGAASLVPVVGIKLVTVPVAVYLLARAALVSPEALWFPLLFMAVSFVVVDYIPDQLLRPYVSGRTLHIGAMMLAYTVGPLLFGWYGIFLGPMILVVVFEFSRLVVPRLFDSETAEVGEAPSAEQAAPSPSLPDPDAGPVERPPHADPSPPDDSPGGLTDE